MNAMKEEKTAKSIVLRYPNVYICYVDNNSLRHEFSEITQGKYEYVLSVGDKINAIRYRDTNYDHFFDCEIIDIKDDGIVVRGYGHTEEVQIWNNEHTAYIIQKQWTKEPFFVPLKKWLPSSEWYAERDMYIEPCEALYEKNKFEDVLSGNIATSGRRKGSPFVNDEFFMKQTGIFFKHGGWRSNSRYGNNLNNFRKVKEDKEQIAMAFDDEEER